MKPPKGFRTEVYPLRHKLEYGCALSAINVLHDSVLMTILRHTNDIIAGTPGSIIVNPHHTGYVEDLGAAVCRMSIIDKVQINLRFNMTENCDPKHETAAGVYSGDSIQALKFLWRPFFWSFRDKADAKDDDSGQTVKDALGVTFDDNFEDCVPISTNKLPATGASDLLHPMSTVNIAEVLGDYNMTTNTAVEDHAWTAETFFNGMTRMTNKGALRSMVGRTRHVTLDRNHPHKTFHLDKFVPRSVRRIHPFSYFAIQVYMPPFTEPQQFFHASDITTTKGHLGIKMTANYHEWNADHYQEMSGTPP